MSKTFLEALTSVGKNLKIEINQLDENVKQLGSGGGSVGTTTTITDEQVTAGMNSIFGEGNWSE